MSIHHRKTINGIELRRAIGLAWVGRIGKKGYRFQPAWNAQETRIMRWDIIRHPGQPPIDSETTLAEAVRAAMWIEDHPEVLQESI